MQISWFKLSSLLFLLLCSVAVDAKLPVVDLGYQLHRAAGYNHSGDYYFFTGIRFARNPSGPRRWRQPELPRRHRATVRDGSHANNCYDSFPGWNKINGKFVRNYLAGQPPGVTRAELRKINNTDHLHTHINDRSLSEDCLFLDLYVPRTIFENKSKAPVLVWFYGGGYVTGSRNTASPAGLLRRSLENGREGAIYVSFNYRLGAFGWLAGPSVEKDGIANAGLYDQRFALEWVQRHVAKFGGDPNRVTIFGESAGGGSILHQITAFGGKGGKPPFQQAILQSPGFHQQNSFRILENQYNRFLQLAGAKSMEELRNLSTRKLVRANAFQVHQSEFGLFTYGPAVDTAFVPKLPGQLISEGKYHKNLNVMTGHNSHEGLSFTNPFVKSQEQFKGFVKLMFPTARRKLVNFISNKLYPPVYSGKYGYKGPYARQALLIAENAFVCNAYYVDKAFNGYAYIFSVPPGLHGDDVPYTYFDGDNDAIVNSTVAIALQDYITTFAQNGKPTSPGVQGLPKFQMYGDDSRVIDLGEHRIRSIMETSLKRRCRFWQRAPFAK